ncbi:4Fe-4S dicluster domain-containing protein [Halothermothrix orenii]|uniref:Hydrogenase large subunit domain protein n=1 Tax=Halothermothrix orenii (strain H 168 / OCM 544 / DSM 9562) TaxID=373903 RepID=B8D101_HALOH|nr:4Fe-4S dicluster domain-containing protein [Halothermothrix orenii]ACL68970.1 hydrogenase large subunit domain protein [Halothermothrix orenii H 168]
MAGEVSEVTRIRRKVLTEIARLTFEDRLVEEVDYIPRRLTENGISNYRCCVYKERAILKERVKLALGVAPDEVDDEEKSLSEIASNVLQGQLGNSDRNIAIIEEACDQCSIDKIVVTNACRNCVAHHCVNSCPRGAITIVNNQAYVIREKCVECGLCVKACPYGAILEVERPCTSACSLDAVVPGEKSTAEIDDNNCIECGSCIEACPFGAISYKSEIVRVVQMLKSGDINTVALVAPSYIGQFGPRVDWEKLCTGLKRLGFHDVIPVALGADKVIEEESREFQAMTDKPMFNSCCPSFVNLIELKFPEYLSQVSTTESPMLKAAYLAKEDGELVQCVFIGPCLAKKSEARNKGQGLIDAVLTFEEIAAMLVAKGINLAKITETGDLSEEHRSPSIPAQAFCEAGGVGSAISGKLNNNDNGIRFHQVDGASECLKVLNQIKAGKIKADFVEGMGCQGGCIGGPGTLVNRRVASGLLKKLIKSRGGEKVGTK